jgi:hypothetical protein
LSPPNWVFANGTASGVKSAGHRTVVVYRHGWQLKVMMIVIVVVVADGKILQFSYCIVFTPGSLGYHALVELLYVTRAGITWPPTP